MPQEKFIIRGGKMLSGTIETRGSKNAAGPALAAALLAPGVSHVANMPRIEDMLRMCEIIESMGGAAKWQNPHALRIDATQMNPKRLDLKLVKRMRSSIFFAGALLARFGEALISEPGGCLIGARSIDTHLKAFEALGVRIRRVGELLHFKNAPQKARRTRTVVLREFSVSATENVLLASSCLEGKTVLKIAAQEPHVQDLCDVLQKMGVHIQGVGTHTLVIEGTPRLRPFRHTLIPDPIEAGTFLILGALASRKLLVKYARADHLDLVLEKLRDFGVVLHIVPGGIEVRGKRALKAQKVECQPYPGIPSDLQAPFGVLATQAQGVSLIHDKLYEGRFQYLAELNHMGARAYQADLHRAFVAGPTKLSGTSLKSFDLRAGATLIIAGLIAKGKTEIADAYQVDRGYERIEERLRGIGADIQRISNT